MTNTSMGAGWLSGRSWHDRRQDKELSRLYGELSAQRSAQRGRVDELKRELSRVQATLTQRLDHLTASFEAFVRLSDLRDDLSGFRSHADARHEARQILLDLAGAAEAADGRPVVDVTFASSRTDVQGYWLPPAAQALAAVVRGEADSQAGATARERDATRTDLFLCLGLLLVGRPDVAIDQLGGLFMPSSGADLNRAQRQLWVMAAAGRFGETGSLLVADRLQAVVAEANPEQVKAQVQKWQSTIDTLPSLSGAASALRSASGDSNSAKRRAAPDELLVPVRAAERLEAMHAWCDAQLAAEPFPSAGPQAGGERLLELLTELVDEGSTEERPLLDEVAQLRAIVDRSTQVDSPVLVHRQRWHDPIGDPLDLLRGDAEDEAAPPALRRLALRAATPLLGRVADQMADAAAAPLPAAVELRTARFTICANRDGVDRKSVEAAQKAVELRTSEQSGVPPNLLWPLCGAAVLSLVLALFAMSLVLLVLGVGFAAGAVSYVLADQSAKQRREAYVASQLERLQREADQLDEQVRRLYTEAGEAASRAPDVRHAIEALLTADGAAPARPLADAPPQAAPLPQDGDSLVQDDASPVQDDVSLVQDTVEPSDTGTPGDEITYF